MPFGPTLKRENDDNFAVNFSIHSQKQPTLHVCPVSSSNEPIVDMSQIVKIPYRTGDVFHVEVDKLRGVHAYWYTVDGVQQKVVLDPWAKYVQEDENLGHVGLVGVDKDFEWGDEEYGHALEDVVIYECNIGRMGGYKGVKEKIWYFKDLGINAVEFLPMFQFSESGGGVWGYCPINFFSPHCKYATGSDVVNAAREFKELVRELHRNNIEVYLDVVYNHTENRNNMFSQFGVTDEYYIMQTDEDGSRKYGNMSGCGNTFSPNSPMMSQVIIESLRWWVSEYHVDGFRFDAGGVFCRSEDGTPVKNPAVIKAISKDPVLSGCKLFVEPWDAGDSVGSPNFLSGKFPEGDYWFEWNPVWRDAARKFIRGDEKSARPFCKALRGSMRMYHKRKHGSLHSVNYVCSHDGFCLSDLVSYQKRTNKDGYPEDTSFNCGHEGALEGKDSEKLDAVRALRNRQMRNLVLALFLSRGIPMISMGDEYGVNHNGNNNMWKYDGPSSYLDTTKNAQSSHDNFFRFVKGMIKIRNSLFVLRGKDFWGDSIVFGWLNHLGKPLAPHSPKAKKKLKTKLLVCFVARHKAKKEKIYAAFNMDDKSAKVKLPSNGKWHILVDIAAASPNDFREEVLGGNFDGDYITEHELIPRSSIVLISDES